MICRECETVAHCMKNGCVPKLLDLDSSTGFTFGVEHGTFIGEVEMLKWLVENRSKDYWEHVAKEGKRK